MARPEEDVVRLRAEVERLQRELGQAKEAGEQSTRAALTMGRDNEEVPTGQFVKVRRCVNPWEKDATKQRHEEENVPTFIYKIDMPPVGGVQIMLDGMPLFHGETYTLDLHQLRTVKDIVWRLRKHEDELHGSNENAYRQPANATFSGKTGGRVH